MPIPKPQSGFTLIEIAIVLVIVATLLGYAVAMIPMQQELKRYREAGRQMDEILDHLIGFAQVNGRLPCPDTVGDVNGTLTPGTINGIEDTDDLIDNSTGGLPVDGIVDNCKAFAGFLPARTLGMSRGDNLDNAGILLDPWGERYRYHVSNADAGVDGVIDLISPNGVRDEGLANVALALNLVVCQDSTNPDAADIVCPVAAETIIANAAVVIYTSGRDRAAPALASDEQNENRDDFHDGTNDRVYVATTRRDVVNQEYDDKVRWISPNLLFSKMILAEQLP